MSSYPRIFRVRQKMERPRVDDPAQEVHRELSKLRLHERSKPAQTVAITVGSRGIANIAQITKAAVDHLKSIGLQPFIVPAMGSHGGGKAERQRQIVEEYGVTEEYVGCPIKASMETVIVCETSLGFPVHFDRHAYEADHVLVCGRVKPHTDFVGEVESGLMKMMLIGLGKHNGALVYHRAIQDYSFPQIIRAVVDRVLEKCHILAGLAIIENGYDETAKIEAVLPENILTREAELLQLARRWMPRLPFDMAHILLIDQIGKNISGAGMDTNVVGRKFDDHKALENEFPKIRRIVIRGLTEETHGNASGIGMAEFILNRAVAQIDMEITRINSLTSGHVSACMMPPAYETDREVLDAALPTIGLAEPPDAKIMWIRDTLHIAEVECSEAYLPSAREREDLEILTDPRPLPFDAQGNLPKYVDDFK